MLETRQNVLGGGAFEEELRSSVFHPHEELMGLDSTLP